MEIRALLSAMWRNKTGPLLVAAQVALTLAVVVNMAYIVRQKLEDANKPTGLDLTNTFWIATEPIPPAPPCSKARSVASSWHGAMARSCTT